MAPKRKAAKSSPETKKAQKTTNGHQVPEEAVASWTASLPSIDSIVNTRTKQRYLSEPLTVGLVGCSFSGGQARGGVEHGPRMLTDHGLVDQIKSTVHFEVEVDKHFGTYEDMRPRDDEPDPEGCGTLKNVRFVSRVTESVYGSVKGICEKGHIPVTVGGDHSIAIGTISGSSAVYDNLGVVWVDAHADINTPTSSTSGNLHGCPVAFLTGLAGSVPTFEWLRTSPPVLPTNRIVYIGLRDVDPPEKEILRNSGIKAFSMHEVDRWGIGVVMDMAIAYLRGENGDCPIHLSFDVDALDPSVCPATGTPVRGGLTFREGHYICETLYQTGCLVAVDIMEVNPLLGDEAAQLQTVQIGCSLIRSALGEGLLY